MIKRCRVCGQPITNTPFHAEFGNTGTCQKHCDCTLCAERSEEDVPNTAQESAGREVAQSQGSALQPSQDGDGSQEPHDTSGQAVARV